MSLKSKIMNAMNFVSASESVQDQMAIILSRKLGRKIDPKNIEIVSPYDENGGHAGDCPSDYYNVYLEESDGDYDTYVEWEGTLLGRHFRFNRA